MERISSQINDCLVALHQWHTNASVSESSARALTPKHATDALSGCQIARQFSTEAAKHLSQQQFHQLLQFLKSHIKDQTI
jgi:hypothetical protein